MPGRAETSHLTLSMGLGVREPGLANLDAPGVAYVRN